MAHFAELDENNIVLRVLVVPDEQEHRGQDFLADDLGLGGRWIQTSYNNNIRQRFAGIGSTYDEIQDVFIHPQPKPWYELDENNDWFCPEGIHPWTGLPIEYDDMYLFVLDAVVGTPVIPEGVLDA